MSGPHHRLLLPDRSPLHGLAPQIKIVATAAFAVGVALTPRRALWAFAVDAVVVVGLLAVAGYRPRLVATRATVIVPFLLVALALPFVADGEPVAVGPMSLSTEGLWAGWNTLAKTTIGFGAGLVLAGTTPVAEFVRGLGRLRVPVVVVSIVSFMFRYLDLIVEEMGRMRLAMTARGHDPRWLWQARPMASAAGATFVRSYERGERIHGAMLARGFDGHMPDTGPSDGRPDGRSDGGVGVRAWAVGLTPAAISVGGALVAITLDAGLVGSGGP